MKCRHCDVEFQRSVEVPIPHDRCTRCHEEMGWNEGKVRHTTPKVVCIIWHTQCVA